MKITLTPPKGARSAVKVLPPRACARHGKPQPLFHSSQELGIGEADLVHDEPAPMGHLLCHFLAGCFVSLVLAVKAKSTVDGLALEICRIDGLDIFSLFWAGPKYCTVSSSSLFAKVAHSIQETGTHLQILYISGPKVSSQ